MRKRCASLFDLTVFEATGKLLVADSFEVAPRDSRGSQKQQPQARFIPTMLWGIGHSAAYALGQPGGLATRRFRQGIKVHGRPPGYGRCRTPVTAKS